jgi:hypothetical protein
MNRKTYDDPVLFGFWLWDEDETFLYSWDFTNNSFVATAFEYGDEE